MSLLFLSLVFLYHNDCSVALFTLILDTLGGSLTIINANMCSYALNMHHVLTIPLPFFIPNVISPASPENKKYIYIFIFQSHFINSQSDILYKSIYCQIAAILTTMDAGEGCQHGMNYK